MPRRDVTLTLSVAPEDSERAQAALLEAGFSVDSSTGGTIEIRRASVSSDDDGRAQEAIRQAAFDALDARGIAYTLVSSGVVVAGGTPAHKWVNVVIDGKATDLKILAANDQEADEQLDGLARDMNIERDRLNIHPPPGWGGYP